jgi:hypothetical protein
VSVVPDDPRRSGTLAGLGIGAACLCAGALLLRARRAAHRTRRLSLVLFGTAMAGYGLGQVINGVQTLAGTRDVTSLGDLVASAVTPLLLVGFAAAPSVSRVALPVTRLIVDGALLGTVTALVMWELVVPLELQAGAGWSLLLVVVVATSMAATIPLTAAVRDGGLLLAVIALSVVLFASVDGVTLVSRVGVAVPPALTAAGLLGPPVPAGSDGPRGVGLGAARTAPAGPLRPRHRRPHHHDGVHAQRRAAGRRPAGQRDAADGPGGAGTLRRGGRPGGRARGPAGLHAAAAAGPADPAGDDRPADGPAQRPGPAREHRRRTSRVSSSSTSPGWTP